MKQYNAEMEPKVSIIVAVYNVEPWIRRALDSLKGQTIHDFEVIMVDDGSTDNSGVICDEYASEDGRFRVIHQANGGVAAARQIGLENARGMYIIHADPDDWTEPDMLQVLTETADKEKTDIVICDFIATFRDGRNEYHSVRPSSLDHEVVFYNMFQKRNGYVWNKLIRTCSLRKYGLKFQTDLSYAEDVLFNACFLQEDVRIAYVPKGLVHYCYRDEKNLTSNLMGSIFYQKQRQFVLLLRKAIKPEYHVFFLKEEVRYAMSALTCRGEEIGQFSKSFSMLKKNYGKYPLFLIRLYLFCSFHGLARETSFFCRLFSHVKKRCLACF